jgi:hypothetical protein
MAKMIIMIDTDSDQVEKLADIEITDGDWEESCYRLGCQVAREVAVKYLEEKAEQLDKERPNGYRVKNTNPRTLVTRFGDITFSRRLYQDRHGEYHFLLDEYMNWRSYQAATPSLTEALLDSATGNTFRKVGREVEKYTAGVLSASTVHRLLQKVTQDVIDKERDDWHHCFEEGTLAPPGDGKIPILYTEADGLWIHLQQDEQEHYELKNAIAYEGWERIPGEQEGYSLVGKKIYCRGDDSIPFWEGAGIEWHKWWDLGYTRLIVVGGDDAEWIDKGTEELGFSVRQLSGFHLARSCRRGWENGGDMYDAIRSGRIKSTLGTLKEREGKTAEKSRDYVLNRLEKGVDWREKVVEYEIKEDFQIPEGARGLGAIEGNESNLFADRMKDRGMSWTISGAQHMGKAIQLAFNGELAKWCGGRLLDSDTPERTLSFDLFDELNGYGKRTALPATEGPHASRQWVKALKDMTSAYNPLN